MIVKNKPYLQIIFIGSFFYSYVIYSLDVIGIQEITEGNFAQVVEKAELPVFVKISAQLCPNCKRLEAIMVDLLDEFRDRCVFASIDIEANQDFLQKLLQDIFQKYHHILSGFPSVLVFSNGVFIKSFLGLYNSKQELAKTITEILSDINFCSKDNI